MYHHIFINEKSNEHFSKWMIPLLRNSVKRAPFAWCGKHIFYCYFFYYLYQMEKLRLNLKLRIIVNYLQLFNILYDKECLDIKWNSLFIFHNQKYHICMLFLLLCYLWLSRLLCFRFSFFFMFCWFYNIK